MRESRLDAKSASEEAAELKGRLSVLDVQKNAAITKASKSKNSRITRIDNERNTV